MERIAENGGMTMWNGSRIAQYAYENLLKGLQFEVHRLGCLSDEQLATLVPKLREVLAAVEKEQQQRKEWNDEENS